MSGNPFRRKDRASANLPLTPDKRSLDVPQASVPGINTGVAKPAKKTVRIISPHSASENEHRLSQALFSPPVDAINPSQVSPSSTESSRESSPIDPFDAESSDDDGGVVTEDRDLQRNTLANARSPHSNSPLNAAVPLNQLPNAFTTRSREGERPLEKAEGTDSRPHYSVDEFKTLLLSGRKAPMDQPTPAHPPGFQSSQGHGDNSSSTDASSISRQSIFEPLPGLQQDTPRTSHEVSPSDDERWRPFQTSLTGQRAKPSTPKSHHGRVILADLPQAIYTEGSPVNSTTCTSGSKESSPFLARTPTDLNKPLPPPPVPGPSDSPTTSTGTSFPDQAYEPESPTRARQPPLPPLARRSSQHRPKSLLSGLSRPIDDSGGSPVSIVHPSSVPASQSSFPPGSKIPPPPPPRRPGAARGMSESSSASALSTIATPTSSSFTDDSMSNSLKSRPPVPPTRNRSTSSTKRSAQTGSQSGSPSLPPAPPPRRRGSNRSETERQRSGSAASSIQGKDIIADLSALQREVDALRGKLRD